jgi:pimeloyl-ACP methyl ester carboxylesterase
MPADLPYASLRFTASDGLALHARDYRPAACGNALPVICLPGLARTAADFHELACALASDPVRPRRVVALDYRGRGQSDRDPNPGNYDVAVESADIQTLIAEAGIARAAFVGTSRGGIHVMSLAAQRPEVLAAAILNDIGPVIELAGLMRVRSYVGRGQDPATMKEAAQRLRDLAGAGFTSFGEEEWLRFAERTYVADDGALRLAYDPALAAALAGLGDDTPLPELWHLFDALKDVPLMAIRGANSDILSRNTFAAMKARRPDLVALEIPGQGHAPPLWEPEIIADIAGFVAACDKAA